jgi:hypothetical protein
VPAPRTFDEETFLLLESEGGWGRWTCDPVPHPTTLSCQSNWATYMVTSGAHRISSNSGVSQDSIVYLLSADLNEPVGRLRSRLSR